MTIEQPEPTPPVPNPETDKRRYTIQPYALGRGGVAKIWNNAVEAFDQGGRQGYTAYYGYIVPTFGIPGQYQEGYLSFVGAPPQGKAAFTYAELQEHIQQLSDESNPRYGHYAGFTPTTEQDQDELSLGTRIKKAKELVERQAYRLYQDLVVWKADGTRYSEEEYLDLIGGF